MNIKNKLNYSNVASSAALVLAVSGVGGAAYAAGLGPNTVGSPQIKDGQVKTVDLGQASVTGAKVKAASLGKGDLNKAAVSAFTAGAKAYHDTLNFHNITSGDPDKTIFEFTLPAGNYLVSASANITNKGAATNDFTCSVSQPIGADHVNYISISEVRVDTGGDLGTISLDGLALNTQGPIELTMTCEGEQAPYSAQVVNPRMVAVKVGKAVQQ